MNPMQMIQAMKNPQQFLQNIMSNNQIMQNPMMQNAMQMFQNGDTKGMEQLARNLCKEKNINIDEAVKQIRNQIGM